MTTDFTTNESRLIVTALAYYREHLHDTLSYMRLPTGRDCHGNPPRAHDIERATAAVMRLDGLLARFDA